MRSKRRPDNGPEPAVTIRPAPIPPDEYDRRAGEAVGIALAAIERDGEPASEATIGDVPSV